MGRRKVDIIIYMFVLVFISYLFLLCVVFIIFIVACRRVGLSGTHNVALRSFPREGVHLMVNPPKEEDRKTSRFTQPTVNFHHPG